LLRSIVVDVSITEEYLALGGTYCDIVRLHEGGSCEDVYVKIFNDKAFEGKGMSFMGKREACLTDNVQGG